MAPTWAVPGLFALGIYMDVHEESFVIHGCSMDLHSWSMKMSMAWQAMNLGSKFSTKSPGTKKIEKLF